MATPSSQSISTQYITTPSALSTLMQSLLNLPNNPASLYLSTNPHSLTVYILPKRSINVVSLAYLARALQLGETSASALKSVLETSTATKVFWDVRMAAKTLLERCGIQLVNPSCVERAHIHEVQIMELALRRSDYDREWPAGLGRCIARDADVDDVGLVLGGLDKSLVFDERILYLPVLWRKYHDHLLRREFGVGGSFWIVMIREATQKRLAVSRGEIHRGYSIDGAKSAWDKESLEEQIESWNEDVVMDARTDGEFLGGNEHWAKFDVL